MTPTEILEPPLSDLVALIAPPPEPLPVGDLHHLETTLGFALPDDYRQLVTVYGPGWFCRDWQVWTATDDDRRNLAEQQDLPLHGLTTSVEAGDPVTVSVRDDAAPPADFATPAMAEQVTAWGATSGGEYGYWHRISPDPNRWPVLVTDFTGTYDYHPGGLVAYLLDLYSNQWPQRNFMPADILPDPPFFYSA
jgi:hypothetical protein